MNVLGIKIRKTTGKWGNIGTGAWAGFVVGRLGAAVAALVGFGTWVVGEQLDIK